MARARGRRGGGAGRSEDVEVELTVTAPAHGGEGLGRHEGRVVFVPGAFPGDRVRLRRVRAQRAGRLWRAVAWELLEGSTLRRPPSCPARPACGGCPWHELDGAAARCAKARLAREALQRIGGWQLDAVAGLPPVGSLLEAWAGAGPRTPYRVRARLAVQRHGGGVVLGYRAERSDRVVRLPEAGCPLLVPHLARPVLAAAGLARRHAWPEGELRVAAGFAPEAAGAAFLVAAGEAGCSPGAAEALAEQLLEAGFVGAEILDSSGRREGPPRLLAAAGAPWLSGVLAPLPRGVSVAVEANGSAASEPPGPPPKRPGVEESAWDFSVLRAQHHARTFTQPSRMAGAALVAAVLEALGGPGAVAGLRVLELHAGAGHFTLPLAALGAEVTAVEAAPEAFEALERNVARAGLQARVRPVLLDAGSVQALRGRLPGRIDAVLLDPPRTGYRPLSDLLAALGAPPVVYVSCEPSSLARDTAPLRRLGYRLEAAAALDTMPGTWHVESVLSLRRA